VPSEAFQTVSAELVVRAGTLGRMSRPLMIGAGLLAGGAIVVVAHLVGADPRGFTGGQPGFLSALLIDRPGAQPPEQPS
jgi:hypothetical protein